MSRAAESLLRLRLDPERSAEIPAPGLAGHLDALGREAIQVFEDQGIPTRKLESWKGTNLAPLEAMDFARVNSAHADASVTTAGDGEADLVFIDGRLARRSTTNDGLPEGVRLLTLAEAAREVPEILEANLGLLPDLKREPLAALNTSLFEDAAVLLLDKGAQGGRTIRVQSIASADSPSQPSADFPRLLVVAGQESAATIVFESVCGESRREDGTDSAGQKSPGLTGFVAEYHLAKRARVEAIQIQRESAERVHITNAHARVEANAHFDSHVFNLGDGLVRSELAVTLEGPGAETRMRGFFLGRNEGHIDHFTTVDHRAPHCTSDQEYRGVLGDASKGVFRGRVVVQPGAQKTDARQSNPNLLLSNRAMIDTKPQLEIYADDIRASHGSTIGQIDPDALFFLRARGIDESVARLVLTRAFAQSIVDGITDESTREDVAVHVEEALSLLEVGPSGRNETESMS